MIKELRAKFDAEGFEVGKDVSFEEWQMLIVEFGGMYDQYATMLNQVVGKIDEVWSKYEYIRSMDASMGGSISTMLTRAAMGIDENANYGDWMEKWAKEICEAIDRAATFAGYKLRSDLFREDDIPLFGAKFSDNPNWKIRMTLEAIEE